MLSLAEMKSTEPRRRLISEAAAVEVPTAVPWITSKMLAESTAETRYSLMEAGICNGKGHHSFNLPQCWRAGSGTPPLPLCCSLWCTQDTLHLQQPKHRDLGLEDTQAVLPKPLPGPSSAQSYQIRRASSVQREERSLLGCLGVTQTSLHPEWGTNNKDEQAHTNETPANTKMSSQEQKQDGRKLMSPSKHPQADLSQLTSILMMAKSGTGGS